MTDSVRVLAMPAGAALERGQAQRVTCLALVLSLVQGRSVPIQVVERIAAWCYDGQTGEPR